MENLGYKIGQVAAIVRLMNDKNIGWIADVEVNPLQKLSYEFKEATKKAGHPLYEELMGAASDVELPSRLSLEDKGRFYIGYYHKINEINKNSERKRIGETLKSRRTLLGLSQKDVADRAGMLQTTVSKIEAGKFSVSIDLLNKLSEILNCKVELAMNKEDIKLMVLRDLDLSTEPDEIKHYEDCDFLTEHEGRDGNNYIWYYDCDELSSARNAVTGEKLSDEDIERLFC